MQAPIRPDETKLHIICGAFGARTGNEFINTCTIIVVDQSQEFFKGDLSIIRESIKPFTLLGCHEVPSDQIKIPQAHAGSFHRQLSLCFTHLFGGNIRGTNDDLTYRLVSMTDGESPHAYQAVDPIASANVALVLRWLTRKNNLAHHFFYLWLVGSIQGIKPASSEAIVLTLPGKGLPTGAAFLCFTGRGENPKEISRSLHHREKSIGRR